MFEGVNYNCLLKDKYIFVILQQKIHKFKLFTDGNLTIMYCVIILTGLSINCFHLNQKEWDNSKEQTIKCGVQFFITLFYLLFSHRCLYK